jgi:hypothetical protein
MLTMKVFTITRDSGANVKILKNLEKDGFISIHDVMLENGRENKKVKDKIIPVGVWGHGRLNEMVWGREDSVYDDTRQIIGNNNIKDAMHLEAHIRNGHDYFVTEDRDFLSKRQELEKKFSIKIATPAELDRICRTTS